MLTINRPFYAYRDIYLFIAVGLATFLTTFIVLGVVNNINSNQLSQSFSANTSSTDIAKSEAAKVRAARSTGSSTDGSRQNEATGNNQPYIDTVTPPTQTLGGAQSQTSPSMPQQNTGNESPLANPVIVVEQPATSPAPSEPVSSGEQDDDESLINLPTNILPPLPLLGGLIDL